MLAFASKETRPFGDATMKSEDLSTAGGTVHPLGQRARSPRDDVWDVLTEFFGNPRMDTERTMFGKVVAELLRGGATAEETRKACEHVLANFDHPSVFAVVKWFSVAQNARPRRSVQEQALEQLRRQT